MMNNVHLVGDNDEDLYSGYGREDVAPALETADLEYDPGFQAAVKSSYGKRPPTTAMKMPGTSLGRQQTAMMGSSMGRPTTGKYHYSLVLIVLLVKIIQEREGEGLIF